jgi:phosphoglycerate dehydrogenase-like enzyme
MGLDQVRFVDIDPAAGFSDEARGVEALLTWEYRSSLLRDHWRELRNLRWIHVAAAGVDGVLFPELVASDVVVTNSRHIFDRAMAEYTIGLMLCLAKDLPTTLRRQADHTWAYRETETLFGKTLAIIGVGPIAREIGRLAAAFGMRVQGVGRTARQGDPDFGNIIASDGLARVLPEADYIVAVVPRTAETDGLIDAKMLALLKPSARLVNVGRATTVDQRELGRALAQGRIAGAALDVFDTEPLSANDPLWKLPNVVISPHMAGDYTGWRRDIVALFTANLERWLRGEALVNVVDKTLGYVPSSSHHGGQ